MLTAYSNIINQNWKILTLKNRNILNVIKDVIKKCCLVYFKKIFFKNNVICRFWFIGKKIVFKNSGSKLQHDVYCFFWVRRESRSMPCVWTKQPTNQPGNHYSLSVHPSIHRGSISLVWCIFEEMGRTEDDGQPSYFTHGFCVPGSINRLLKEDDQITVRCLLINFLSLKCWQGHYFFPSTLGSFSLKIGVHTFQIFQYTLPFSFYEYKEQKCGGKYKFWYLTDEEWKWVFLTLKPGITNWFQRFRCSQSLFSKFASFSCMHNSTDMQHSLRRLGRLLTCHSFGRTLGKDFLGWFKFDLTTHLNFMVPGEYGHIQESQNSNYCQVSWWRTGS